MTFLYYKNIYLYTTKLIFKYFQYKTHLKTLFSNNIKHNIFPTPVHFEVHAGVKWEAFDNWEALSTLYLLPSSRLQLLFGAARDQKLVCQVVWPGTAHIFLFHALKTNSGVWQFIFSFKHSNNLPCPKMVDKDGKALIIETIDSLFIDSGSHRNYRYIENCYMLKQHQSSLQFLKKDDSIFRTINQNYHL